MNTNQMTDEQIALKFASEYYRSPESKVAEIILKAIHSAKVEARKEIERLSKLIDTLLTDKDYEGGVQYWIRKHDDLASLSNKCIALGDSVRHEAEDERDPLRTRLEAAEKRDGESDAVRLEALRLTAKIIDQIGAHELFFALRGILANGSVNLNQTPAENAATTESEYPECPNCKERKVVCACLRNLCIHCGKPVGNITFTACDECFTPPQESGCAVSEVELRELDGWIELNVFGKEHHAGAIRNAQSRGSEWAYVWGEEWKAFPKYTTDKAAAMEVLEKILDGTTLEIGLDEDEVNFVVHKNERLAAASSFPLAICLFAKQLFSKDKA